MAIYFRINPENTNFFDDEKNFIIQSKWENRWDTGCIMDLDKKILAFFYISESWKPPRTRNGHSRSYLGRGLTADFWLETNNQSLLGEIYGFPPPLYSFARRNHYEIYNSEKKLVGVVWEKIRQFGSKWVLENPEGEIVATIRGNRLKKNYMIITQDNLIATRCYRTSEMSENLYRVDILESDLDTFLILCYILVLDRVRRYPTISRQ